MSSPAGYRRPRFYLMSALLLLITVPIGCMAVNWVFTGDFTLTEFSMGVTSILVTRELADAWQSHRIFKKVAADIYDAMASIVERKGS